MKLPSAVKVTTEVPVEIDGSGDTTYYTGTHDGTVVLPKGTARGGATFEAEIRWAIDAIKRGDTDLAVNRLTRILGA